MIAYLLRHGQAGRAPRDSERALTDHGRKEVARVASKLARTPTRVAVIYTSPYQRATETAEMVSSVLDGAPVRVIPGLAPGADVGRMLELLHRSREEEAVCIVGHMPDLGELAALFAWGERGRVMDLSTGTLIRARLEFSRSGLDSALEWVLTPEEVR